MAVIGEVSSSEIHKGDVPAAARAAVPVRIEAPAALPTKTVVPSTPSAAPATEAETDAAPDVPPAVPESEPTSDANGDAMASAPDPLEALEPAAPPSDILHGVDLSLMKLEGGKYRQRTDDGREIVFTVDAELQSYTDKLFAQYEVPAGAAVVLNSRTGRVIALSQERSIKDAAPSPLVALDASPPAASLFKIVTAAALFDNGIPFDKQTCYAGGSGSLNMQHLADTLPKNHACVSMTYALAQSVNAVFAKLSDKFLNRAVLQEYAARFGFNRALDFDVPIQTSDAEIPEERLERARTAAGFWHTHLSPVHAASIVQSLAQDGAMLRPYIVERVSDASGNFLYKAKTKYIRHIVSKETAARLKRAMVSTTLKGTAHKSFHDAAGRPFLPGIDVAGKTGTLTGDKPYRAYTWFVGLAPIEKPEVAVSVLVVNTPKWRIKAPQMAALILKKYFEKSSHRRR